MKPASNSQCHWRAAPALPRSPNTFLDDVMDEDDAFLDQALERLALFAFNQATPAPARPRALVREDLRQVPGGRPRRQHQVGDPLDASTQTKTVPKLKRQLEKILNSIDIGKKAPRPAACAPRRAASSRMASFASRPPLSATTKCAYFRRRSLGPSCVTKKTLMMQSRLATIPFAASAPAWSRNVNKLYRGGRGIQAGRAWTDAAHKIIVDHYQQKLLVNYSSNSMGPR